MKLSTLTIVVVLFLLFAATSCKQGETTVTATSTRDQEMQETIRRQTDEREAWRQEEEREQRKLNNSNGFWPADPDLQKATDFYVMPRATSMSPSELKLSYQDGIKNEKSWQENRDSKDPALDTDYFLCNAIRSYAEVAVIDDTAMPDLVRVLNLGLDRTVPPDLLITTVMDFAGTDNPGMKQLLPKIQAKYIASVRKETKFNPALRYTPESKLYDKVDDINVTLGETFTILYRFNLAAGQKAEAKKWEIHLADWLMSAHSHEGGSDGPSPRSAYVLYLDADLPSDARRAAMLAGNEFADVFFNGYYTEVEAILKREPFLEFDVESAKKWYGLANLRDYEIQFNLQELAIKSAKKQEKACDNTPDACKLAQRQYTFAGKTIDARRMELRTS